jgi:hypothetical protein
MELWSNYYNGNKILKNILNKGEYMIKWFNFGRFTFPVNPYKII